MTGRLGPTYRVQLGPGFDFDGAAALVPYLAALGIDCLYCSPVTEAVPGSTHGYDGTDPTRLRDELGGDPGLRRLGAALADARMGCLLDIVPNHLSTWAHGRWWRELLRCGEECDSAAMFDVDWDAGGGKVTLPLLDGPLEDALARGAISFGRSCDGEPVLLVGGIDLPVSGGDPRPDDPVEEVLATQHYRLVDWHDRADRNYRRFFDIDGLVGVCVERPEVFAVTHALVAELVGDGIVTALRVDHVDGLAYPGAYLERLHRLTGGVPVVVEKILTGDERLRAAWHAAGTTGYEVMDDMGGALVEPGGLERLAAAGRAEGEPDVATCAAEGRRLVATTAFAGALGRVASGLRVEAPAVVEAAIALPVYRTYLDGGEPDPDDVAAIAAATGGSDEVRGALEDPLRVQAVIAWQQTTGAVMAKGVEDTAWYRLPGRLAFCEVGGAPGSPREVGARRLHERAAARAADGRAGLVPSTTHDTKRSGDARARLYALTELAEPFEDGLRRYRELLLDASGPTGIPAVLERAVAGESRLLAQMILAVLPAGPWPDRTATTEREPDGAQLPERVALALAKSAREAKLRTSWNAPDLAYEAALARLAEISLRDGARVVHDAFSGLVGDVARLGATLSLSSVVLRSALPGVPDCYQGDEVWNLSLVDPDNRRYVAFDALARRLEALELTSDHRPTPGLARECRSRWRDGDVKLLVTASCLAAHRFAPGALAPSARYLRVGAVGPAARNVLAFGRLSPGAIALAITTRCPGVLDCADDDLPAGARSYGETRIELPGELRGRLADVCTGREVDATSGRLEVSAVLADLPVALLVGA